MPASLTIIRYPIWAVPFAIFSMAVFRLPLMLNKKISFYKLMGSGKNGTFDKTPDLQQWAILCVHEHTGVNGSLKALYGKFIAGWLRLFRCETFTLFLEPVSGHGKWDGKHPFDRLNTQSDHIGVIATLTRATIRPSKLSFFWKHVAPVANQMKGAKGFITSFGIGEIPWIKQATFSVWESAEDMKAFAYGMKEHAEVVKKTRLEKWYSEDMFIRFKITGCQGTIRGLDPLAGKM